MIKKDYQKIAERLARGMIKLCWLVYLPKNSGRKIPTTAIRLAHKVLKDSKVKKRK